MMMVNIYLFTIYILYGQNCGKNIQLNLDPGCGTAFYLMAKRSILYSQLRGLTLVNDFNQLFQ